MQKHLIKLNILLLFLSLYAMQTKAQNNFEIIALGTGGGVDESNVSSYLVSAAGTNKYIALDAGTLMHGLKLASEKGHFNHVPETELVQEANILHNHIDAYCISHPHLDHISGMMLAGPFDNNKTIFGADFTIDILMEHVFLSPLWGNFTTEGNKNGKWDICRMQENRWYPIPNNDLEIKYLQLCHSCPNLSSAFLVKNKDAYLLYLGDTGADKIENSNKLDLLFDAITPLIKENKLKAIFIEASFPNSRPNNLLFGHLKPELIEEELEKLAMKVNLENTSISLKGIHLFITHLKPDFKKENSATFFLEEEIKKMNTFGATTVIIKQSDKYKI